MIPYGRQDIRQSDIDAVIKVLKSEYLTQGPMVPLFEELIAAKVNSKYAVAANSATSALHLACLALDIGKNDIVWTSPISFVASANCVLYTGAKADFVDIDPHTFNMCVTELENKLKMSAQIGRLPKAVIVVHMCGQSADMKKIFELSQEYKFKIIEDASHAIGASYGDKFVGSCEYSDITVFSFHPVKIITTAEGGVATTNDHSLAEKMMLLRSHGVTRDGSRFVNSGCGEWYYEQHGLGFNYRMSDIQAALGISQLERLEDVISIRNDIAKKYDCLLEHLPVVRPHIALNRKSSWHLYIIKLIHKSDQNLRQGVFERMRELGIGVNVHYIPIHLQPFYRKLGFKKGDFPKAEAYYNSALTLPIYTKLTDENQVHVVNSLSLALQ